MLWYEERLEISVYSKEYGFRIIFDEISDDSNSYCCV
jgi:hypothetical protein